VSAEERWLSTELPIDREHRRAIWLDHLKHDDRLMLVAADGRRAVGEIAVYQHPEYGPLIGMMVNAAYRGRGVGKHLLQGAIDWATHKGYPEMHLLVFAHNERARALYERCGFIEVEFYPADVTRINGEAWDTILMVRKLGGAS
jgi:RimJ/RimL family protein N-acetyltransferase